MRFRLVEDVERAFQNFYDRDWEDMENKRVRDKVSYLMKKYMDIRNPSRYPKLKSTIEDSIDTWSYDPNKNRFLAYLLTLATKKGGELANKWDNDNVQKNLEVLKTRALAGDELKKEWYYDVPTLERPYKEFTYVINVADILSDDRKRAKYFGKNLDKTTVDHIYTGDEVNLNGKIKETGIGSNNPDTIFGMINDWTQKYGVKDNGKDEEDKMYSVVEVMRIIPETKDKARRFSSFDEYLNELVSLGLTDKYKGYTSANELLRRYSATDDSDGYKKSLLSSKIVDEKTLDSIFVALEEKAKGLGL